MFLFLRSWLTIHFIFFFRDSFLRLLMVVEYWGFLLMITVWDSDLCFCDLVHSSRNCDVLNEPTAKIRSPPTYFIAARFTTQPRSEWDRMHRHSLYSTQEKTWAKYFWPVVFGDIDAVPSVAILVVLWGCWEISEQGSHVLPTHWLDALTGHPYVI